MRLLASTAAPTNNAKHSPPFGAAALHAAAAHQYRNAALDAGAKALALFERRRSFVGLLALRRLAAAALRNADRGDGAAHARGHVLFAEEAAIGAIEVRGAAERAAVALERGRRLVSRKRKGGRKP